MKASEAKQLTRANLRGKKSLLESVSAMAKAGNFYASFDIANILDPEVRKTEFEDDGYKVEITSNNFKITWD